MLGALTQKLYQLAHDAGEQVHGALARRPRAARSYFRALSALRALPEGAFKHRVLNSIASRDWPELELPFQSVTVGRRTQIRIRPHPGEFDMRSLVAVDLDYERVVFEWLESVVADYDTIVEIGANVGVYTVFFGQQQRPSPSGPRPRIYAFEPADEPFMRLQQNLRANGVSVHTFKCAVADRTALLEFFEPKGHLTNGSLRAEFARYFSDAVVTSKVLAVDGAILARIVGSPGRSLLKIDVEGAECTVLRGLQAFIEAHRPDILIEVLPIYVAELRGLTFLNAAGYGFYTIDAGGLTQRAGFEATSASRDMLLRCP